MSKLPPPPFPIFSLPVPQIKKITYFQSFMFFFFLITEFRFVVVFNFIKLSYFLFIPLFLDDRRFAFKTEEILKFSWKINLTDHWSLSFPGNVVYFCLIYVFKDENLPIYFEICQNCPLTSFQSSSPPAQLMKITHHDVFTFYLFIF